MLLLLYGQEISERKLEINCSKVWALRTECPAIDGVRYIKIIAKISGRAIPQNGINSVFLILHLLISNIRLPAVNVIAPEAKLNGHKIPNKNEAHHLPEPT